jgi:hypothetical protein
MKRLLRRLLCFLFFILFVATCLVLIAMNGILWNIDPEKTDRKTFVRIMQIRDFRRFSPDFIERLTNRAEREFGRHSPNRPTFDLPAWERNIHIYFQTHRSSQPSNMENNLTMMIKTRYFQLMYEYQSAASDRKAALMSDVVADMRYWREIYFDYVRSLGQPEPTLAELFQDFQRMIAQFKEGAAPEEIELIDKFAKDVNLIMFAAEVQKSLFDLWNQ